MPELPEVQTTASILHKLVIGLKITDVWTDYGGEYHLGKKQIKDKKYFQSFRKNILGAKITHTNRRGKNVLIYLDNKKIIAVHMKMTGHLLYGKYKKIGIKSVVWEAIEPEALKDSFNQFIHLVFSLSDGKSLALSDMRKFAKVNLTEEESAGTIPDLAHLGPEPLEKNFDLNKFKERLMLRPTKKIKQALMDQEIIAGIGNIYSDEILFASGVHPLSKTGAIPKEKFALIFKAMKLVLEKGIDFGGDSMSDYRNPYGERGEFQHHHKAYRKTDLVCERKGCGGIIERIVVGGRSAHFCPRHQKKYEI